MPNQPDGQRSRFVLFPFRQVGSSRPQLLQMIARPPWSSEAMLGVSFTRQPMHVSFSTSAMLSHGRGYRDHPERRGGSGSHHRVQIQVLNASTSREIEAAFESIGRERPDALFVSPDPFFHSRRDLLVELAARYAVPAIYQLRDFVIAGGLISYGTSIVDAYHQVGVYAGANPQRREARPTFRSCSRPSSNWSSISRPPRRSA